MANYSNLEQLKENSIQVTDEMVVVRLHGTEELMNCSWAPKYEGSFATNNSCLAFVEEGKLYVTPYTREAIAILQEAKFKEEFFYVPFSNGDYPKEKEERWEDLRNLARDSYEDDFARDCERFCDEKGVGALDEAIIKNCFEIPAEGIRVRCSDWELIYYPAIMSTCLDSVAEERLGTFWASDGNVTFVYRDGKTYIAKGYGIIESLEEAGYREKEVLALFASEDEWMDEELAERWENLPIQ